MRSLAASLVAFFAVCGSARALEVAEVEPNDDLESANVIAFANPETAVLGDIAQVDDPADHFLFSGLDSDTLYNAWLNRADLAFLHLDESGLILGVRGAEFPMEFAGLRPDETGELRFAVCSLGDDGFRDPDCSLDPSAVDEYEYDLHVDYVPEPGANALRLAALLGLAAMSRRRA